MEILHDETNHRFYCIIDGTECFADYSTDGTTIDFFHTYVPQTLRGQGIARKIYDHVSTWLEGQEKNGRKLKVKTSCYYAEKYFSEKKL